MPWNGDGDHPYIPVLKFIAFSEHFEEYLERRKEYKGIDFKLKLIASYIHRVSGHLTERYFTLGEDIDFYSAHRNLEWHMLRLNDYLKKKGIEYDLRKSFVNFDVY